MISAVLLAAGESRRMGEFKQLLPFGESTFVEHCVDELLKSRVDEVIVVTGHRDLDVRQALGGRAVEFAYNDRYRLGMTSSIQRGVCALSPAANAFVVALVDQPQIDSRIIDRLIDSFADNAGYRIIIPIHDGKNGHPILLDASLIEEILRLKDDQTLRDVVHSHPNEVLRIESSNRAVIEDCDVPEDYRRLMGQ